MDIPIWILCTCNWNYYLSRWELIFMDMWVYKLTNHEKNNENLMEIYWDNPPQLRSAVAPNTLRKANIKLLSVTKMWNVVKIHYELWLR